MSKNTQSAANSLCHHLFSEYPGYWVPEKTIKDIAQNAAMRTHYVGNMNKVLMAVLCHILKHIVVFPYGAAYIKNIVRPLIDEYKLHTVLSVSGWGPLHAASWPNGSITDDSITDSLVDSFKALVECGCNPSTKNKHGETAGEAYDAACTGGNVPISSEIVDILSA